MGWLMVADELPRGRTNNMFARLVGDYVSLKESTLALANGSSYHR